MSGFHLAGGHNGLGIHSNEAASSLLSIGDSKKKATTTRGFRGIGRLSGLSYCSTLTFETSAKGDHIGVRITIDSSKLSEILANVQNDTETILNVLSEVYSIETYPEKENMHYFSVIMDGVDDSVKLTDYDEVIDVYYQEIAFEELDMLIGSVKGSTSFKALNSMKGLSSIEKKTLEKVFQIIIKYNADTYPEWIDFILNHYSQGDATNI